jgi:arabinogalactan endo-1,4-beta-galactosidase
VIADRGATHARLRVWVHPADGRNGLPLILALARRTHAAGLRLSLALHLSDTWADPRHQQPPAAWRGLGAAELRRTVHDYTASVVQAFAVNGTPVDLLQVGNEIGNGLLWPAGSLLDDDPQGWAGFTSLLRAGLDGARQVDSPPRLAVHLESGGDNRACRRVLDRLADAGVEHDVTALSYYPFWNGPLAALADNLADLAQRYGRDLLVAETAYPWTLDDGDGTGNVVDDAAQLPEGDPYPPTPQGQYAYFEALRGVFTAVPNGLGAGFLVWQPAWVPGVGVLPGRGNPHDNLGLFDRAGRALPALDCLRAN